LCYSCFLGAIFYRQSIHFMPKRKVINPLVFKRNNAPRKPTLTSTSSTRKKTYRWIGFDGSVKVIDEDSIHQEEERERVLRLTVEENKWRNKGYTVIVGVDEAGRGPLAGPVVAAACILPPDVLLEGLNDSKKLSPTQRNILYENIQKYAIDYAIGQVDHDIIDQVNIFQATMLAVQDALKQLGTKPDMVIADGPHWKLSHLDIPLVGIVKADATILSVCAASILAKETRDRWMIDKASVAYPEYGFEKHKGYPTAMHRKAIKTWGPCPIHRMSFRPLCDEHAVPKQHVDPPHPK